MVTLSGFGPLPEGELTSRIAFGNPEFGDVNASNFAIDNSSRDAVMLLRRLGLGLGLGLGLEFLLMSLTSLQLLLFLLILLLILLLLGVKYLLQQNQYLLSLQMPRSY
jgi:hypothetical protein